MFTIQAKDEGLIPDLGQQVMVLHITVAVLRQ